MKFIFDCVGERWCFSIPRTYTIESSEQPELVDDYMNLEVGDVLTSNVGHADYNTASFEVELTVRAKKEIEEGYHYLIELTKYPK